MGILYLVRNILFCCFFSSAVDSTCTFPDDLKNKVFEMRYIITTTSRAETLRTINISTSTVADFLITAHSENRDQWTCLFREGDSFVLKSNNFVDNVGTDSYIYFGFNYYPCVTSNGVSVCLIRPLCDAYSSALDEQVKLIPAASADPTTISEIQGSSVPDAYYLLTSADGLASVVTQTNTLLQTIAADISSLKTSNTLQQQNLSALVQSEASEEKTTNTIYDIVIYISVFVSFIFIEVLILLIIAIYRGLERSKGK